MPMVNVRLSHDEVQRLAARAVLERRSVRDQASWLLARTLRRSAARARNTSAPMPPHEDEQEQSC